jgi:hypothetical protein
MENKLTAEDFIIIFGVVILASFATTMINKYIIK